MAVVLTDSEIRSKLLALGEKSEDIGPITPSTRSIYVKRIESILKANKVPRKTSRKSETSSNDLPSHNSKSKSISNSESKYNRMESPNNNNYSHNYQMNDSINTSTGGGANRSDWNSSIDSDRRAIVDESVRKRNTIDRPSINRHSTGMSVSPVNYSIGTTGAGTGRRSDGGGGLWGVNGRHFTVGVSGTNDGANGRHYSSSSSGGVPVGSGNDPSSQRWFRGSLNTISNYFVSRGDPQRTDLMDISDADMSDNEAHLMTRLRKKYFTKTHATSGSSVSSTAAADPCERKSPLDKRSGFLSWISWNHLPNLLLVAFIVFSVALFVSYLLIKQQYSMSEFDIALTGLTCEDSHESGNGCFSPEEMRSNRRDLGLLYDILSEHAGRQMCEHSTTGSSGRQLSYSDARIMLNARLSTLASPYRSTSVSNERWSSLMKLLINLQPRTIDIAIYDNTGTRLINDVSRLPEHVTYLEGLRPKMSLLCRLKMGIALVFSWVTYILCLMSLLVVFVVICYFFNRYRLRKIEMHERYISEMKEIVSSISDLLQDQLRQSEYTIITDKFLPLSRIRSLLQQTHPKLKDNKFWEEVKQFMYRNEPLIELKETIKHGEILQWRCQPGWQGSAVQREYEVRFERGPTECIKIRNMDMQKFDENGRNYLRREVMSRIKDTDDVKDIQFLTKGSKVIVYVMCSSREAAGRAFRRINANYFNGNLLNVKFIRLDKYLERFPDSKIYV